VIRAKNYETVSKFVKVMTKKLWPLFFPDTVYVQLYCCNLFIMNMQWLVMSYICVCIIAYKTK